MPDMRKTLENKEKIISVITSQGPSFPTRIARATGIPSLFVSAFLSELVNEKRIKLSNMKVGSSPLYFLSEQEKQLENFVNNLGPKERDAFELLKNSQIISDEQQTPAIRVALRSLKDFAFPVNVRISSQEDPKLFWRYFSLPPEQVKSKIQEILTRKQTLSEKPAEEEKVSTTQQQYLFQQFPSHLNNKEEPYSTKPKKIANNSKKTPKPSEFANSIRKYLAEKDIEMLESLSEKKREFISTIRTDTIFGKQSHYLIAKDKKRINTNDLTIALQHSREKKMPALILSTGELDKKAKEHLIDWQNLIKFEKIKT